MTRLPASPDLPAAVAAARAHLAACADECRGRRWCRHQFRFPCTGCGAPVWASGGVLARNGEAFIARARCWACFFGHAEVRP